MLRKNAALAGGALIAVILTYLGSDITYINLEYVDIIRSTNGGLLRKTDPSPSTMAPAITRVLKSNPAETIPLVQHTFPRRELDSLSYRSVPFEEFSIQPSSFTVSWKKLVPLNYFPPITDLHPFPWRLTFVGFFLCSVTTMNPCISYVYWKI